MKLNRIGAIGILFIGGLLFAASPAIAQTKERLEFPKEGNFATVTSSGSSSVQIKQVGNNHAARVIDDGEKNNTKIEQDGVGSLGDVEVHGSNHYRVFLVQDGAGPGGLAINKAHITTEGSENGIMASQSGSLNQMNMKQSGHGNRIDAAQDGRSHRLSITQGGEGNPLRIYQSSDGGQGSDAEISQNGVNSGIDVIQFHDRNKVVILQDGASQDILLRQDGSDSAYFTQKGTKNLIDATQKAGANTAKVNQNGENNIAKFTQANGSTLEIQQSGKNGHRAEANLSGPNQTSIFQSD